MQTPDPNTTPNSPHHGTGFKVATAVLFVIIVFMAAYVVYLVTPKPAIAPELLKPLDQNNHAEATKGWRTYTSDKQGFEFKYPNTWAIWHVTDEGVNIVDPKSNEDNGISVAVYPTNPENIIADPGQVYEKTDYELKGVKGKKLESKNDVIVIVPYLGKFYTISVPASMFEPFISTFKFTK